MIRSSASVRRGRRSPLIVLVAATSLGSFGVLGLLSCDDSSTEPAATGSSGGDVSAPVDTTDASDAITSTTSTGGPSDTTAATETTQTAGPGPGPIAVDGDGVSIMERTRLREQLALMPLSELTDADRAALVFMREEEKLAGDVYVVMSDTWDRPIFANIAEAEATHAEAVSILLERYEIADPAAGAAAGAFSDPDLQALYDDLVERGRESLEEAMVVGALIEEIDIADLRERTTEAADVAMVFTNLELASRNHLRAFVGQLERMGVTYEPLYLDQAEFAAIVAEPIERSRGA